MTAFASLICGLIFGTGLVVSGMTQPAKVLGFLDLFGHWDPTLAFVMVAALVVSAVGFGLARRQQRPLLAVQSLWPTRSGIDRSLVVGSILFGAGWGLVGLCPGPALVNLATLMPSVIVFVLAMAAGMILKDTWDHLATVTNRAPDRPASSAADG
ncbi:YeeE/YedE family protein [Rhodoplanes sp. Z2-YC6860]|uniref:YeeE/YedE family protein n=1 Tax=Rhodoplanes sp. Z2-YC6860 TaxID=674703 RepID=UPI00078B5BAC|nr:YeeE/YedE family protein [Rhodoplanes sp. Z2-YC6860]AMN40398.1 YeeE/YedE family protein [Rhodoplanes sp. Z2-YC6860]